MLSRRALLPADAHPFTYLMDHAQESERFDPDGNYVRRWLPVLARLPKKWIHRYMEHVPFLLLVEHEGYCFRPDDTSGHLPSDLSSSLQMAHIKNQLECNISEICQRIPCNCWTNTAVGR